MAGRLWRAAGCAVVFAALAAPAAAQTPRDELRAAVEQVPSSTGHRYGATDDRGAGLDTLKVIEGGGRYLGVYHSLVAGRFEARVATSADLLNWTYAATLDRDASQPTIAALPDGGYLVAYEKADPGILPPLPGLDAVAELLPILQVLRAGIRVRFRHYPSLGRLLAGGSDRQFTAPLSLSPTAEGTPSIRRAELSAGLSRSRIDVGLHYFADENGDDVPDVDRQATGVLTNFSRWEAAPAHSLNDAFLQLDPPPQGNIGDRDHLVLDGAPLDLHEAQYVRHDFGSWRPFLRDVGTGALDPLQVVTHGGSSSFGNPTATVLRSPLGRPALAVTLFVFSQGAAPGESGSLVYYRER